MAKPTPPRIESIEATDLARQHFPPITYFVEDMITEGLIILSGRPKIGKSWLALAFAIAIASGGRALGKLKVTQAEVLYLALEDTPRRLQSRLAMMVDEPPPGLYFATKINRINEGGIQQLDTFLDEHPNVRLVIADTAARIEPKRRSNSDAYQETTASGAALQELTERQNISLMLLTHSTKIKAADFLDEVLGSTGITGTADTIMGLRRRARGEADATLEITGRDIEEATHELRMAPGSSTWELLGEAQKHIVGDQRRQILKTVQAAGKPVGPSEVAVAIGAKPNNIRVTMQRMLSDGTLTSPSYGKYTCATCASVPSKATSTTSTEGTPTTKSTHSTQGEQALYG